MGEEEGHLVNLGYVGGRGKRLDLDKEMMVIVGKCLLGRVWWWVLG